MARHGKHVHRTLKLGAKGPDVRELQEGLRALFDHYEIDWPMRIDSDYGPRTKKSALVGLYVIGASNRMRHRTRHEGLPERAQQFLRGSKHPRFGAIRRRHRRKHIRHLRRQSHEDYGKQGDRWGTWVTPSGRRWMVAGWMVGLRPGPDGRTVNWLKKFVEEGWDGELYSAARTPEYSESLCEAQCGAPSCPGTCAGRASAHSQYEAPVWGALDVINWAKFQECNDRAGGPFRNDLSADRPHRSVNGH